MFEWLYFVLLLIINNTILIISKSNELLSNDIVINQCSVDCKPHYITYDIDLYEGFNLRRDVYIRIASLIKCLGKNWYLILPLWTSVSHWNNEKLSLDDANNTTKWSTYFDFKSLNQFIKAIEFEDYMSQNENLVIDVVIALEPFVDTNDNFNGQSWRYERFQLNECSTAKHFALIDGKIKNLINHNKRITYKRLFCVQIDGYVSTLRDLIETYFSESTHIFISKAEMILHSDYGNKEYWFARRSLRFSSKLITIANHFRNEFLNSNDSNDETVINSNWQLMRPTHGQAIGGNYLSVHLRRGDFNTERFNEIPNTECAVLQIMFALRRFDINSNYVFISSDDNRNELNELFRLLIMNRVRIFRFNSHTISDGEKAIVDQWIACHAKAFIGTFDSNFSYRIQEEREILGFLSNTTFNAFCAKCFDTPLISLCKQKTQWKMTSTIVYE